MRNLVIKVASKSLERKERNCAFEYLNLRCGATKKNLRTCTLQRKMPNSDCQLLLVFYFNFYLLQMYGEKVAYFSVKWAALLQMSLEVIQYPLLTVLEGNQYPLAKGVLATL
jgi:hypothetical protein